MWRSDGRDMETDLTVFLEFYGLPGCGKSTISHIVADELRKYGKNVDEPTFDTDHKYCESIRKVIKLAKLVRYAFVHPQKYIVLKKLIQDNGHRGIDVLSQTSNIAHKLWVYEHGKADYVIFDEGLTQSAISMVKDGRNCSGNEQTLYDFCKGCLIKKFYIKVTVETALERILNRDKHYSRIEKILDETGRKNAMKAFEKQCEVINANLTINELDMRDSIKIVLQNIT